MTCKDCIHSYVCEWSGFIDCDNCTDFKNKTDLVDLNSQVFTHVCKNDKLLYPDKFSIFARVVSEDDKTITIDRFQKFGAIYCGRLIFEKKDFEKYYKEIDNDI